MTTIGHRSTAWITTAYCKLSGIVHIYNSVMGVLALSLNPLHPINMVTDSSDGAILFCIHRDSSSITT